jgi:hypothetical protein
MNIIGLGKAGCNIAEQFERYTQYKVYKIDAGLKKSKNVYGLKKQKSPEAYEKAFPNLKNTFFKGLSGETLFITSCGFISGASLRLLEQIKNNCKMNILYVKPDISLLSQTKLLQENLIFNVLQEYTRSGVFEKLYIVENLKVADIVGDIPVREYFNQINQLIGSTIHMINVFSRSESVMDTFSDLVPTARISTFGLVDYETGEEKKFFDLEMARGKRYYYAIPESIVESDGSLVKKIKKQIKKNLEHDKMKNSYAIYTTDYEQPYVYCVTNSTLIQKNEKST